MNKTELIREIEMELLKFSWRYTDLRELAKLNNKITKSEDLQTLVSYSTIKIVELMTDYTEKYLHERHR